MAESTQHKLDRIWPPRVQITYDVETGGAIQMNRSSSHKKQVSY